MSETSPRPTSWGPREKAVDDARKAVGAGLVVGSITVKYHEPAYDTSQVWIRANCATCPAELVMRASHPYHVGNLAMSMVQRACPENGHQQDGIVMFGGEPRDLGSAEAQELEHLQYEAEDRLAQAQQDLGTVALFKERLLGGEA